MRPASLTHLYAVHDTLALLGHLQLAIRRRPQQDLWREEPLIRLVPPHLKDLWSRHHRIHADHRRQGIIVREDSAAQERRKRLTMAAIGFRPSFADDGGAQYVGETEIARWLTVSEVIERFSPFSDTEDPLRGRSPRGKIQIRSSDMCWLFSS